MKLSAGDKGYFRIGTGRINIEVVEDRGTTLFGTQRVAIRIPYHSNGGFEFEVTEIAADERGVTWLVNRE